VVCTPHLGYVERDNYELYFGTAFDNINSFAAGSKDNIVNQDVFDI
jgi:D-3-phosphoglycerate dehydrogenase